MAISVASVPTHPFLLDSETIQPKHSMWHRWGDQLGRWLGRDDNNSHSEEGDCFDTEGKDETQKPPLKRRWSKRVGVGLPRAPTFRRQNSERRVNLEPVAPCHTERRAASLSADHRRAQSVQRTMSATPFTTPRQSAPEVRRYDNENEPIPAVSGEKLGVFQSEEADQNPPSELDHPVRRLDSAVFTDGESRREDDEEDMLEIELDRKWILNLSMHFRDKSDREKFFVTYAQTPNLWRRVTVSCDYRAAEPESLEKDLKELQFQRDKSARIYESIRESLAEIQFYPTVTNLKLQTSDGRLHVHVTEDANEIIPYPSISAVRHLETPQHIQGRNMFVRESDLEFDAHLSGFVYKVRCGQHDFIKKEIPGPDTVDEFLYEINALHALSDSESVIKFEGIIVDDNEEVVKGLLISYAEKGALVDLLYDYKGSLDWHRRERWAKQIVQGLMEIHEAGYVQGDFTLSNIVVDSDDRAKIIDINRRGCPVGWEPPEISRKIESNQRISMYIGVKSDMFQLGMTLWALAMDEDEPERQDRPMRMDEAEPEVQPYYRRLVELCLADRPQDRPSAKDLLAMFPNLDQTHNEDDYDSKHSHSRSSRSDKRYIDPSQAVEREDIARELSARQALNEVRAGTSTEEPSYINPADSSDLQFESSGSYVVGRRGRSGPINDAHLSSRERGRRRSTSDDSLRSTISDSEPQVIGISPSHGQDFEEINIDGTPYLVQRNTFNSEDLRILQAHEGPLEIEEVEVDQDSDRNFGDEPQESAAETSPNEREEHSIDHTSNLVANMTISEDSIHPHGDEAAQAPTEDEDIDLESSKMDSILLPLPLSLSEQTLTPTEATKTVPSTSLDDSLTGDLAGVGGQLNLEYPVGGNGGEDIGGPTNLDDSGPHVRHEEPKPTEELEKEPEPVDPPTENATANPPHISSLESHDTVPSSNSPEAESPHLQTLEPTGNATADLPHVSSLESHDAFPLSDSPKAELPRLQTLEPTEDAQRRNSDTPESSADPALYDSLFASAHSQFPFIEPPPADQPTQPLVE